MDFETQNWMQIESYLAEDDRIMLVIGAVEQHGYLSLMTDVLIPQKLAQAATAADRCDQPPRPSPLAARHTFWLIPARSACG